MYKKIALICAAIFALAVDLLIFSSGKDLFLLLVSLLVISSAIFGLFLFKNIRESTENKMLLKNKVVANIIYLLTAVIPLITLRILMTSNIKNISSIKIGGFIFAELITVILCIIKIFIFFYSVLLVKKYGSESYISIVNGLGAWFLLSSIISFQRSLMPSNSMYQYDRLVIIYIAALAIEIIFLITYSIMGKKRKEKTI